jgi:hypothetical protein
MAKYVFSQSNFKSGELSPKLIGRTDIEEYTNGAREILNAYPMKAGGVTRRPGTQFFKNLTATFAEDFPVGIYELSAPGGNYNIVAIGFDGTNTIIKTYNIDLTFYPPSVVEVDVADPATQKAAILALIPSDGYNKFNVTISGSAMFFAHPSGVVPPFALILGGKDSFATQFTMVAYLGGSQGLKVDTETAGSVRGVPFQARNRNTSITMSTSGAGTTRTVTASSAVFSSTMASANVITATHLRIGDGSTEIFGYISSYVSSTSVVITIPNGAVGNVTTFSRWAFGAWSAHFGFPKCVCLAYNRLIWANTKNQPDTFWCTFDSNLWLLLTYKFYQDSSTDSSGIDYFGPITTADAFDGFLTTDEVSEITYLSFDRNLQLGTREAEHVILPVDGRFGPANRDARAFTFIGSSNVKPARYENSTLFISKDGKDLISLSYSENNGSNVSTNLSVLSDQIIYHNKYPTDPPGVYYSFQRISPQIIKVLYQKEISCAWCLTDSGQLFGIILDNSGKVMAWHKHILGGTAVITGMCLLPAGLYNKESLYIYVQRKVGASTVSYLETVGLEFEADDLNDSLLARADIAKYLDCAHAVTVDTPSGGFSVLSLPFGYLEGQEVRVVHLGEDLGTFTVTGSTVTLDVTLTGFVEGVSTYVGYPYTSRVQTMPLEAGSKLGNSQAQLKRIDRVTMKFFRSKGVKAGNSLANLYDLNLGTTDPGGLYSGSKQLNWDSTPNEDSSVILQQEDPYPFSILSIVMRGETQE